MATKSARPLFDVRLYIDRPRFRPQSLVAYAVAGAIIALAALLQVRLNSWAVQTPYLTFFPSIVIVALLCGSAAGSLATLLSVLAAWLFILPPVLAYMPVYQTVLFSVGSLTVVSVVALMRTASAHAEQSNEALRISERKFRDLLESAPDAIVIVDAERRIVLINAGAERLFGYRRSELLGKTVEVLLPKASRGQYLAQLDDFRESVSRAPKSRMIEIDGARKSGTEFPIEVSLGPIETETGIEISHVIRDISARREIEKGLAQASKAKSDFLANMSHELRTPLNAIIGFSEIVRDAIIGPLDVRYREYGADINKSGQHLRDVINDILDISRIEGGHLELRDDVASVEEIAQLCGRIVAPMVKTAGVSLEIDIPPDMPSLRTDQMRLQQVLLNLMSNAVKFAPAGGHVKVSAWRGTEGPVIAVEDTGIGMTPDEIQIALEPFRQIDGVLSRRFDGTGLGLPLAKALVELQGGRLEIESTPGAGTTVLIHLPAERAIVPDSSQDRPAPHASAS